MTPLGLDRPRELRELLALAFSLFHRHFSLVYTLALIVVTPYVLVVDGIWGRQLAEGSAADPQPGAQVTSLLLSALVAQPLITAMVARIVVAVDEGHVPGLGEALRGGLRVFAPAAAVVAISTAGVTLGLLALIVPGIYLGVRWYFGPQAVVVEGRRGTDALRRSSEVVQGRWQETFVRLVVVSLAALFVGLVGGALQLVGAAADSPALYVAGRILGAAAASSFAALASTLLFFDRRSRREPA